MKENPVTETPGGELGPPPEKTSERWECPLLCGKVYKTGTKLTTLNDHLEEHAS